MKSSIILSFLPNYTEHVNLPHRKDQVSLWCPFKKMTTPKIHLFNVLIQGRNPTDEQNTGLLHTLGAHIMHKTPYKLLCSQDSEAHLCSTENVPRRHATHLQAGACSPSALVTESQVQGLVMDTRQHLILKLQSALVSPGEVQRGCMQVSRERAWRLGC